MFAFASAPRQIRNTPDIRTSLALDVPIRVYANLFEPKLLVVKSLAGREIVCLVILSLIMPPIDVYLVGRFYD